jgi:hypothetical protein
MDNNMCNIALMLSIHYCRVSELEERLQTAEKHRFPSFIPMHWGAARNITAEVDDFNSQRCPTYLLNGAQSLLLSLKKWNKKETVAVRADEEQRLQEQKVIIRELTRAIKQAQKNIPVKPSRESKRTRIKKVNKDFIDTSRVHFAKAELVAVAAAAKAPTTTSEKTKSAKQKKEVTVVAEQKKQPASSVPSVKDEGEPEIQQPRLPSLKLSKKTWLNPTPPSPPKKLLLAPPNPPPDNVDLTNRDSVRLLLNTKKNTINLLNSELGDALQAFKRDDDDEVGGGGGGGEMVINEEQPKIRENKPKRVRAPKKDIPIEDVGGGSSKSVYQDSEYVYPSLEFSDDEDDGSPFVTASSASSLAKTDTLWSPKVRVKKGTGAAGSRPVRENAKRKEVELGLKYAAEKIGMRKKLLKKTNQQKKVAAAAVAAAAAAQLPSTNSEAMIAPSTPSAADISAPTSAKTTSCVKRPRKGEMTAKQRLGKKLGLKF